MKEYPIISVILSVISGLCCIIIIMTYFLKRFHNFSCFLVASLSLADLLYTIGVFLTYWKENDIICKTQSFFISFGSLASVFITSVIAYNIYYVTFSNESEKKIKKIGINLIIIAFIFAFLLTILMIAFEINGQDGGYFCWIKNPYSNKFYFAFFLFYIWYIFASIFNLALILKISNFLRQSFSNKAIINFSKQLIMYPIILFITFLPGLIDRVFPIINDDENIKSILSFIHIIFSSLLGFNNFIIYGLYNFKRFNKTYKCSNPDALINLNDRNTY